MSKVKLNLGDASEADILNLADFHIKEMTGNANYPDPTPTAAVFAAAYNQAAKAKKEASKAYALWRAAVAAKDAALEVLKDQLTARGNYVNSASNGEAGKIFTSGFNIRSGNTRLGILPAPLKFYATMGPLPGQIILKWKRVHGTRSYVVESKENHPDAPWKQVDCLSRRTVTLKGHTPGTSYAFRVQAIGTAGPGPWTNPAVQMSP